MLSDVPGRIAAAILQALAMFHFTLQFHGAAMIAEDHHDQNHQVSIFYILLWITHNMYSFEYLIAVILADLKALDAAQLTMSL